MKGSEKIVGVFATLGISFTAAIALPLINLFRTLEPSELMMIRGGVTAVLIAAILSSRISWPTLRILGFSLLFSFATLALYASIRVWGANPTLVVLTATPLVNIAAKRWRGQAVKLRVYACLVGLLLGVAIALNPWDSTFNAEGFSLSVAGMFLAGIAFEVLGGGDPVDPYNKTFWLASVTAAVGLMATLAGGQIPFADEVWSVSRITMLTGFGVVGGFVYYLSYIVAFEKLEKEVASTLAMAETPAVIIGAWFMLGEKLTMVQWLGVAIALGAAVALVVAEAREKKTSS